VEIAENVRANLFVSVHINSAVNISATGVEVLVCSAGGKASQCASLVLQQLVSSTGWINRGVKIQNVLVLQETSMPAILTESGFLSNYSDSSKLKDAAFIQALAVSHAKGICSYFGIPYTVKGVTNVLDTVVLLNTKEDYWAGADVAIKNDNCLISLRNPDGSIQEDVMSARKLIIVGGKTVNHPNEVLLSGKTKYDTAAAVAKHLG